MKKKKDKWVIVDEIVLTIRAKETMQQGSKRELSLQINAIRNMGQYRMRVVAARIDNGHTGALTGELRHIGWGQAHQPLSPSDEGISGELRLRKCG